MLFYYLVIINAIAFCFMGADKFFAVKGTRRIPEKTLMSLAAIGGSFGASAAMFSFRHKTKHAKFRFGLPLIMVIHIILLGVYYTQI